jgi:hypothetical protein
MLTFGKETMLPINPATIEVEDIICDSARDDCRLHMSHFEDLWRLAKEICVRYE